MKKINLSRTVFIILVLIIIGLIITALIELVTSMIVLVYIGLFLLPILFILILIDLIFNKEYQKKYFYLSLSLILIIGGITAYDCYLFSHAFDNFNMML